MSGADPAPRAIRLAYLVSHPIQYQAPLLRRIAADPGIALTVFFCSDRSVGHFHDPGFGRTIAWDVALLDGYQHEFLPALGGRQRIDFWRPFNYGFAARLRKGGFDALWVHGYARWSHWVAMLQARRLGLRVLLRDDATAIAIPRGPLKRLAKRVFFAGLRRVVDGFLTVGSRNRDYYHAHGVPAARIFAMPYAVDNERFRRQADAARASRETLRRALGLATDRPVILFAAKLMVDKRTADLLDAHARLMGMPEARRPYLLIAGDGAERAALERRAGARAGDSVRFLGFKGQAELPALFDLADLFVLPAVYERWGLVVNEAMNAGCAVVVSDQVGCAPDLVHPGETGFVFAAGDVAALTRVLGEALADPERCRAMGQRGRTLVADWDFVADIAGLKAALAVPSPPRRFFPGIGRDVNRRAG